MSDVERPTGAPLAELQEQHDLHNERHLAAGTLNCYPKLCPDARWLALCDRLATAVSSHPALTTPPICGNTGLTEDVEARFREIRAENGESQEGGCGQQLGWLHAYRCLECGRWMHAECLRQHFAAHGDEVAARLADAKRRVAELEIDHDCVCAANVAMLQDLLTTAERRVAELENQP